VAPARIADAVRTEARRGTPRLLVCGGDGTLSAAMGAAAGTALEIAVFPGGTLNHFARDIGVPTDDPAGALDVAVNGTARPVDLGCVNGHAILNTSSVGVYVEFVRRRERLERHHLGYRLASVAAAAAVWGDPQALAVDLRTADGAHRRVLTPLLFVGIHERLLDRVNLGRRRAGGARALQILLVKEHTRIRIHRLAFRAAARGIDGLVSEDEIECHLTTAATVTMPRPSATVAVDGELLTLTSPLTYEFAPGAVKVVRR
jgi:diacylglycerol kinase family enzyme